MKNLITKYASSLLLVAVVAAFSSCIKERNSGGTDFSLATAVVQIPEGGLDASNFSNAALLFPASDPSDVATFRINYSDKTVAQSDVVVTIGYDAAALAAYNTANPPPTGIAPYAKFPDSIYSFTATKVTVKAGQSYSDAIPITIYPSKIDPSKNYMFPITITDASGKAISANYKTIYFHLIGNPLAGTYTVVGTRYNYNGVVGYTGGPIPPATAGTAPCGTPKTIAPISALVSTTYYANLGAGTSRDYFFTYNPAVSTTNIDVTFTQSFLDGVSNLGVFIHTYDPVLKKIHILSTYNNNLGGSGNDRVVDEVMTHQ